MATLSERERFRRQIARIAQACFRYMATGANYQASLQLFLTFCQAMIKGFEI
jgi:hypothetical protein